MQGNYGNVDNVMRSIIAVTFSAIQGEMDSSMKSVIEKDFIYNVLKRKIAWAELPVEVDDHVLTIISLCVHGNPAIAQLVLYDLLSKSKRSGKLTVEDFAVAFPMEYPICFDDMGNLTPIGRTYENRWDKQKLSEEEKKAAHCFSDNKVDTPNFWRSIYGI